MTRESSRENWETFRDKIIPLPHNTIICPALPPHIPSITTPRNSCIKITSTRTNQVFIPTNTTGECDAFQAHQPTGISIGSCAVSMLDSVGKHCDIRWDWGWMDVRSDNQRAMAYLFGRVGYGGLWTTQWTINGCYYDGWESRASYYYDSSVAYINTTTNMDGVLVKMENPIPNRRKWVNRKNSVLFAHYFFLWIQKKDKNSASQRREDFYVPEGWEYACSIIRIYAIWYLMLHPHVLVLHQNIHHSHLQLANW